MKTNQGQYGTDWVPLSEPVLLNEKVYQERDALREYYEAHRAVERGVADFDLHNHEVDRLRRALEAVEALDA